MAAKAYSTVEYYAEQERYKCGYCKSPDTNFSHGMCAYSLTVQDYQNLIDRGWRRSGTYCYKPTMDQTCCPMYTIKCEALNFILSKSQRKVLKRMIKLLKNELKKDMESSIEFNDNTDERFPEAPVCPQRLKAQQCNISEVNISCVGFELNKKPNVNTVEKMKHEASILKKDSHVNPSSSVNMKSYNQAIKTQDGNQISTKSTDKPPLKKAKVMRLERKKNKMLAQGKSMDEINAILKENKEANCGKSLEDFFDEIYSSSTRLQNKLVRVMSEEFCSTLEESASLYKKYQMTIHKDTSSVCDKQAFLNFLVRSPLQHWSPNDDSPYGYGSYHDQYWMDGRLIAVGVIDILPSCISSVYFFYDPAYSSLSLGTFSSLREVYLTRQFNKTMPNLKYYYMGFYIHTCLKMRYKARLRPSKLLCPETYVWCDIEKCLPKLDKEKYSRLNSDVDAIDEDGSVDINQVLVLYKKRAMPYWVYKEHTQEDDEDEVRKYATFVGAQCAQSMLLVRD